MKRPLIAVALLFIVGILLGRLPCPLVPLFALAFSLALLYLAWEQARRVLLCSLIVLAGWIDVAHRTAVLSPFDLRTIFGDRQEVIHVRGRLLDTPYKRVHQSTRGESWTSMASLEITELRIRDQDWQPACGKVMASTVGALPEAYFAGQTVEIGGVLEPAEGPVAEGLFDYAQFLSYEGIYYQVRVKSTNDWKLLASPQYPPLSDRFCAWARKTLALGLPEEDGTLRLEWALSLGWKAALTEEVSEPFIRASTYHVFAVDGLRIAIVSGIFLCLLRVAGAPRALCGLLTVPFICFYAAMTGWPASAVRAIVMILVVFVGWALNRPRDLINSLFAAAIFLLVWEPRQLFQAGFQLSFFVVLCIVLIMPFFNRLSERILRANPLQPEFAQPGWRRFLIPPARRFIELFFASIAAWLGSIPLVIWYFHLFTPLSGLANMLAVPLCALILISNLSSLFLAPMLPFVSVLFNNAGWFLMILLEKTSRWSADWPCAYFYFPMPTLAGIALYYLLLLTALTGWLFKGNYRSWKISAAIALVLGWSALWIFQGPKTTLTILPLNGGYAAYFAGPGSGNEWLVDCGGDSSVNSVIKPFLRARGVNRLDNFLLTHGEIAYSGGAQFVQELFRPRNIYVGPFLSRSQGYRDFIDSVRTAPAFHESLRPGSHVGPWTVLYPDGQTHLAKAQDNAVVLRGEIGGCRVLLLSDLSHAGQNALLDRAKDLQSDVIVSGIPADSEPASEALLNAAKPRAVVIIDTAAKKAPEQLKRRLLRHHIPVFYSSETRAVTLTAHSGKWRLQGMNGEGIDCGPF